MLRNSIARLVVVTVAVLATWSAGQVISGSPAFSPDTRHQGVFGDWRVPVNTAMYDRGTYLFQLGYGYMNADTVASGATEGRDELATLELAADRASKAAALLEESVYLDPANAHTWAALAWAYSALGDLTSARSAMLNSWDLAPFNYQLSTDRLNFLDMLFTALADTGEGTVTATEIENAAGDICTAQEHSSSELALLLEESVVIGALSEQLGNYCARVTTG